MVYYDYELFGPFRWTICFSFLGFGIVGASLIPWILASGCVFHEIFGREMCCLFTNSQSTSYSGSLKILLIVKVC
jgi:hypothetical protein